MPKKSQKRVDKYAKYNTYPGKNITSPSKRKKTTKKVVRKKPQPKKRIVKGPVSKKKVRIKYGKLGLFLLLVALFLFFLNKFLNLPITNIFIEGNTYYSDQQIIELASLENYPSSFLYPSFRISSKLEKNTFIKKAKVRKKYFFQVWITIEENYPLFYSIPKGKTVLYDQTEVEGNLEAPTLVNTIADRKYEKFVENMKKLDRNILMRISEIQYAPTPADDTRFLLKMTDDNYVYINFTKFSNMNNYLDIIRFVEGKKGILNLDAGNSFEVRE